MNNIVFMVSLFFAIQTSIAQDELEAINSTLMEYIEGTSKESPSRLRRAFHPDFNLYTVAADTLRIRSGEEYVIKFTHL